MCAIAMSMHQDDAAWSTASGRRLMLPSTARKARPGASAPKSAMPAAVEPPKKKGKSMHLKAFAGPCCNGDHFWGHGKGHKGPGGYRVYKCSECRKMLQQLSEQEQLKRRIACTCPYCFAERMEAQGMSAAEAKSLAHELMQDGEFD